MKLNRVISKSRQNTKTETENKQRLTNRDKINVSLISKSDTLRNPSIRRKFAPNGGIYCWHINKSNCRQRYQRRCRVWLWSGTDKPRHLSHFLILCSNRYVTEQKLFARSSGYLHDVRQYPRRVKLVQPRPRDTASDGLTLATGTTTHPV